MLEKGYRKRYDYRQTETSPCQQAKGSRLKFLTGYQNLTDAKETPGVLVMKEDTEQLDEVVVTALGIKRSQKALSYNVQEVKNDVLTKVKDANFVNSLSGKVAGVSIQRSASAGGWRYPRRDAWKQVYQGDNNVLYVIDGVPMAIRPIVRATVRASAQDARRVKVLPASTLKILKVCRVLTVPRLLHSTEPMRPTVSS